MIGTEPSTPVPSHIGINKVGEACSVATCPARAALTRCWSEGTKAVTSVPGGAPTRVHKLNEESQAARPLRTLPAASGETGDHAQHPLAPRLLQGKTRMLEAEVAPERHKTGILEMTSSH